MKSYKISRSAIELFLECPKCFYLKYKKSISRPSTPPLTLYLEVDKLAKKEFDKYRISKSSHPIQKNNNLPLIPAQYPDLDQWRHNFTGVKYQAPGSNILLYGSIDDLWFNPTTNTYSVVDYKATSSRYPNPTKERISQYARQLSFYSWLISKNGLQISDTSYIILYNAFSENDSFEGILKFSQKLIPVQNNYEWIEPTIEKIKANLDLPSSPDPDPECKFCIYNNRIRYIDQINSLPF